MANNWSFDQYHHHRRRDRDCPPSQSSAIRRRPNFVIELCSQNNDHNSYNRHEIVTLMGKFTCEPDDFFIYEKGVVAGRFFYRWLNALETIVYLWEVLLNGGLSFMSRLRQNLIVPSDTGELNSRLRILFSDRIKGFMDGELVSKWEKKLDRVSNEIGKIDALLRKPKKYVTHMELSKKKEGFVRDKLLIGKRIDEFKAGMECILDYVNGKVFDTSADVKVLKLKGNNHFENTLTPP